MPSTAVRCLCLLALTGALCASCRTRDPYTDWAWSGAPEPGSNYTPKVQSSPYTLAMFEGSTGRPLSWPDLWEGMKWADIVIIGEQHDDAVAHRVQLTMVEEAMVAWPGSAISMEMLERNEQAALDAYMAGSMDRDAFMDATNSRNWAGKDSWVRWYQPMVDAARDNGGRVVAANAPREYVRRARLEGYEALAALPPEERAHFDLPAAPPPASYRERFREFMSSDGNAPTDEELDTMLRSQRLWDATMAASIVGACKTLPRNAKVVHVVGQFHSEFDGGLVSEIQARDGSARILTISVQKGETTGLRAEDKGKADVVAYGMAPPPTWSARASRRKPESTEPPALTEEALPEWGVAY